MPLQLKLASALFIFLGALVGAVGILLAATHRLAWPFLLFTVAFAVLEIWVGINLSRGRPGIMPIARLLGVLALLGSASQVINRQSVIGQPWTSAVRVIEFVVAIAIVTSLFWRGTDEALKNRSPQRSV
jgi:hypothetical protein